MAIGYKTTWIAVRERSAADVAAALGLTGLQPLPWEDGTDRAYGQGVYVGGPVAGWTLAHGRHLPLISDYAEFPGRLSSLSTALGEVQFFGTHRGVGYAAWAHARHGRVLRAYSIGDGELHHFRGEPTDIERALGKATLPYPQDPDSLDDDGWDAWWRTVPGETDVMRVAGAWSVDPTLIEDVPSLGLYTSAATGD
ncbi:hypothetical protein CS0771_43580 [Catellatospora sp. IY07-71]|uniref:hypothetical protein n=1 Tax=Catellatospora sp. IY07-71 TaxID=2728827 RepID=UPI001BB34CEC|nr:hypothetical protein [Catellatospora sp. IY07-71]BCJ74814.1 hypothetical protein CS0771_43580 [Catellatospora sp. IY07-71]